MYTVRTKIESRVSGQNAKRKKEPTYVGGECAESTATLLPYHSLRMDPKNIYRRLKCTERQPMSATTFARSYGLNER